MGREGRRERDTKKDRQTDRQTDRHIYKTTEVPSVSAFKKSVLMHHLRQCAYNYIYILSHGPHMSNISVRLQWNNIHCDHAVRKSVPFCDFQP